jgi:hypothetical protein
MIRVARRDHPGFDLDVADLRELPFGDASLQMNDVGRVANVVSDDMGYPAPWQALPGVVFPQASEAPPALAAVGHLPPQLLSTTASATISYIWDLSRRVDTGNDQAEPCWIPIPSCKDLHASLRRLRSPADDLASQSLRCCTLARCPQGVHGGKVPPT